MLSTNFEDVSHIHKRNKQIVIDEVEERFKMYNNLSIYNLQYLVSGGLSVFVSVYILTKRPRTFALRSLLLFGLVTSSWAVSVFLARTAPDATTAANFFMIVILTSHLGLPLYLLTVLNVRGKRNSKILLLSVAPAIVQTAAIFQDYFVNYEFFPTELGWFYKVVSFQLPLILSGVIFLGYLATIFIVLFRLTGKTTSPLLKRKYVILLVSFTFFQAVGTTLTNALIAFNLFDPRLGVGGILQFLTFFSIWYALSIKEKEIPLSTMGKDFSQVYSSFLTVYFNSIAGSPLGEEFFMFKAFLTESEMENKVSFDKNKTNFKDFGDFDIATLTDRNLKFFDKNLVGNEVTDHYLRVLNAAYQKLDWRFGDVVKANEDFLKKSDLIYGISGGKFLEQIAEDESLTEIEDLDACLKIYKRILMRIIREIQTRSIDLHKILSGHHIAEGMKISNYGEISIEGVKQRLQRIPKDQQISLVIEVFNSVLSSVYENLFKNRALDVEEILGKLMMVLTLNKERAISLGVYPTLLGRLATKMPRGQTHRLYSDYLEELVQERTRELKETQENLLKSQRFAAIGEAATMVGHDLRNPLQAIVYALYMAKKRLGSSPNKDLEEIFITINEQVEYMNKIVSDLQDYARPLRPKLAKTRLRQILNQTLSAIRVPENVEVSIEIENDSPFFNDPVLMRRVFTNLIMNALQAMPKGGRLTIKASKTEENMLISFQDTGVGIPAGNLGKIFQPLFTTKAKGQGLGLAVCKRLVEALNGSITVESKAGRGTTFTIRLPSEPKIERNVLHLRQTV